MDRELIAAELENRLHDGSSLSAGLPDTNAAVGTQVTAFDLDDLAFAHHSARTRLGVVA